jgi:hypothetical protein
MHIIDIYKNTCRYPLIGTNIPQIPPVSAIALMNFLNILPGFIKKIPKRPFRDYTYYD